MAKWAVALAIGLLGTTFRASAQTAVSVDVASVMAQARPELYSLNFQNALDPAVAGNANYQARVNELQPRLVRYHAYEQLVQGSASGWIDFGTRSWNASKIDQVLRAKPASAADVLVTITGWPSWMDANNDHKLDADQKAAYATFCADLVRVVNTQLGRRVTYWEPFNEKDGDYRGATDMAELADIFRRCAAAMKAQDPSIKLVGGAWRQPWDADIDTFLAGLNGTSLDVWSYHNYGSGGQSGAVGQVYPTAHLEGGAANVRGLLNRRGFGTVPVWLDEWNIFWTWEAPGYALMTNHVGAVFDALVFKYLTEQGVVDAAFAWNAADSRYGKMRADFSGLTPGGELLRVLRQYGVGDVLRNTTADATKIEALAVRNPALGKLLVVLANKSQTAEAATLSIPNWNPTSDAVDKKEISATGFAQTTVSWAQTLRGRTLTLPPNSVTMLILTSGTGAQTLTPQTIAFGALPGCLTTSPNLTLTATSSSGLPVSYRVTGPAALVGANQLDITGEGHVTVVATQAGNAVYSAAAPVQQEFSVSKAPQVIAFDALPDQDAGGSLSLAATASGDPAVPVVFSLVNPNPAVATLSGNVLALKGVGTVTVRASKDRTLDYAAATPVDRTFVVRGVALALNAGGPAYASTSGVAYQADAAYVAGGQSVSRPTRTIAGAGTDNSLYQTERYGEFAYALPLENGTYELTLKFAELYFGADVPSSAGQRVFDVLLENETTPVLDNLDLYAATGGANRAYDRTFVRTVADGVLNVQLRAEPGKNSPQLCALLVKRVSSAGSAARSVAAAPAPPAADVARLVAEPAGPAADLSAYPNPSPDGHAALEVQAAVAQTAQVYVRDAQGQLVGLFSVPLRAGQTQFRLPGVLRSGMYYLQANIDQTPHRFTLKVE